MAFWIGAKKAQRKNKKKKRKMITVGTAPRNNSPSWWAICIDKLVVRQRSWLFVLGPAGCHPHRGYLRANRATDYVIDRKSRQQQNRGKTKNRDTPGTQRGTAIFLSGFCSCSSIDFRCDSAKLTGRRLPMIRKVKNGYKVLSEDGKKNLGGPYKTRAEAQKRLRQVEFFKHRKA
jgi:hypothetical protein